MTISNAKNSLTILLGITIIASVGIVSSASVSFGWHDFATPKWSSPTHTYKCDSSLNSMADSTVNECGDLSTAANTWNSVSSSNWSLTKSSNGEIEISGANLGSGTTIAMMTPTFSWFNIADARIEFNTQKSFTDVARNSGSDSFDWKTTAIHEMGHLLKLNHDSGDTSSPMYPTLDEDVQRRSLTSHDIRAIQGKY